MGKSSSNVTLLPPILAALVGSVLFAAYLAPFYGALDRSVIDDSAPMIVTEDFDMPSDMTEDKAPVADASPDNMPAEGVLQRVEPREPLSELGLAATVPSPVEIVPDEVQAGSRIIHQPIAVAAGRLSYGGQLIDLTGIEILEPDETCTDIGGEVWPCGMQARTAFRGWLRNRALTCIIADADAAEQQLETSCNLAGADPARWLVENGWARAKFGSDYSGAQAQAEKALIGVFGRKPQAEFTPFSDQPTAMQELAPFGTPLAPVEEPVSIPPAEGHLPFPPIPQ